MGPAVVGQVAGDGLSVASDQQPGLSELARAQKVECAQQIEIGLSHKVGGRLFLPGKVSQALQGRRGQQRLWWLGYRHRRDVGITTFDHQTVSKVTGQRHAVFAAPHSAGTCGGSVRR